MKKAFKLFTVSAFFAVIVLCMAGCGGDNNPSDADKWAYLTQGDDYKPIVIPEVSWKGDTYELGGNSGAWDVNVVTTTKKENGSFTYSILEDERYKLFDVLHVKSIENSTSSIGTVPTKISKDNHSSQTIAPGILFMWDHTKETVDNYYQYNSFLGALDTDNKTRDTIDSDWLEEHGWDEIPDVEKSYYPGILKVHEKVFQKYIAFVLKIEFQSGSKDYLIMPQRGQLRSTGEGTGREGDSYVFYIAEAANEEDELGESEGGASSSNPIKDVYLVEYIESEIPDTPPEPPAEPQDPPDEPSEDPPLPPDADDGGIEYHPDEDEDPYGTALIVTPPEKIGNKFVIISTATNGGAEVDPENKWKFSGKPIKAYWDDLIKSNTKTYYDAMTKIKNSEGKRATWIWDRSDSWMYGVSGCFTVITASRFYIDEDEEVVESTVPFYFVCDNACAVYVNGKLAGYTERPFANYKSGSKTITRDKPGQTSDWRFTGLDNTDFDGTCFGYLYMVNIKSLLQNGHNEILVMAANNDDSGGRWNTTNNPAGLLFACEFNVRPK